MTESRRPKRVKDWAGGYIRTKHRVSNGYGSMPAGTIFKITSAGITAHFESIPCECCGFQFKYSNKSRYKFNDLEWLGYQYPEQDN